MIIYLIQITLIDLLILLISTIIEFRRFLQIIEESRMQWQETTAEAQRLQRELDKCAQERSDFETKLLHARRMLETESKARRAAENERDNLVRFI